MNTYSKILITTLPLVFFFLFAAVGTTYYFSYSALTDLAEIWLKTRLSEGMVVASEQNDILQKYSLEDVPASIAKAKLDAGNRMADIEVRSQGYLFAGVLNDRAGKSWEVFSHSQQILRTIQ